MMHSILLIHLFAFLYLWLVFPDRTLDENDAAYFIYHSSVDGCGCNDGFVFRQKR